MIPIILALSLLIAGSDDREHGGDLPDPDTVLQRIYANLRSDRLLQSRYTFNLKQSKIELDERESPQKIETEEYEVFPYPDDAYTYRRLIAKNGRKLADGEIEKQDREHDKKLRELAGKLEEWGIDEEAWRARVEKEERAKEALIIREIPEMYDIKVSGREIIDGRNAIVIIFKPRSGYKSVSKETNILSKLMGKAWFCEHDYQLMRAEVEFTDDLTFGMGLLARLHKGAKAVLKRRYINNEIWMPEEVRFTGTARILLLKKITINTLAEFSGYRKFTVESAVKFRPIEPKD